MFVVVVVVVVVALVDFKAREVNCMLFTIKLQVFV